MGWEHTSAFSSRSWTCGYCGKVVGGDTGYYKYNDIDMIYICPNCDNPTAFIDTKWGMKQIPEAPYGSDVQGLPTDVSTLYREIRCCIQHGAPTAAMLALRKLLMHIAVDKGADPGKNFVEYVEHLSDAGYVPPNAKEWVERIRKKGNEANHQIVIADEDDAKELMDFTEMLLRFAYEFPAKLSS